MPILDVRTMVLIYVGIRMGQALVLIYLWRVQRNYPPAKEWALGALLTALGLLLLGLRDLAPVFITHILANALVFPGAMYFEFGIARAAGKKPPVALGWWLCAGVLAVTAWYTYGVSDYAARVITQNIFFISLEVYAAYACFTVTEAKKTLTFRMLGSLIVVLFVASLWRVADGVWGVPVTSIPDLPRLAYIAISIITFPMTTMLLTLHTSQRLQEEINEQALRDMLTGAYNRRALEEFANREWARATRHGYPLAFLTVDIDHFKKFNDQYGHQTGDATLVLVSNAAQTALRSNDIWCRHGGEEFVALLPDTTMDQALAVAERLRREVEQATLATASGPLHVSVSIGVAERSLAHAHWSEVLAASDAALYAAKAAGRNRVVAGGQAAPEAA